VSECDVDMRTHIGMLVFSVFITAIACLSLGVVIGSTKERQAAKEAFAAMPPEECTLARTKCAHGTPAIVNGEVVCVSRP